jgi:hypothetical protein
MNKPVSYIVVFGIDSENKPHAAQFPEGEAVIAAKAAQLMGFQVGRAEDQKAVAIAKDLPVGKTFATGKALVPLVKQDVFDQLKPLLQPMPGPAAVSTSTNQTPASQKTPEPQAQDLWACIKTGSIVLAQDKSHGGWFEAVVVGLSSTGTSLILRWHDWPKLSSFTVARTAVGLPPSARAVARK